MTTDTVQRLTDYFSHFEKRSYRKGQVLIFGGEAPRHVYYLVQGSVRQYDISYRGDEIVVNTYKAPAFFSMPTIMSHVPNRYFFETTTDVELYQAPPETIVDFLQLNPDVMFELLCTAYAGVDGLLERMAHLMGGSAQTRVLYELALECRECEDKKQTTCLIALNESELAARSGLTRETVSREIHKLKVAGLLDISRKGILLKDPGLLEEKLGLKL